MWHSYVLAWFGAGIFRKFWWILQSESLFVSKGGREGAERFFDFRPNDLMRFSSFNARVKFEDLFVAFVKFVSTFWKWWGTELAVSTGMLLLAAAALKDSLGFFKVTEWRCAADNPQSLRRKGPDAGAGSRLRPRRRWRRRTLAARTNPSRTTSSGQAGWPRSTWRSSDGLAASGSPFRTGIAPPPAAAARN